MKIKPECATCEHWARNSFCTRISCGMPCVFGALPTQLDALLAGREQMGERILRLRQFINDYGPHSGSHELCPTCNFLKEDAK